MRNVRTRCLTPICKIMHDVTPGCYLWAHLDLTRCLHSCIRRGEAFCQFLTTGTYLDVLMSSCWAVSGWLDAMKGWIPLCNVHVWWEFSMQQLMFICGNDQHKWNCKQSWNVDMVYNILLWLQLFLKLYHFKYEELHIIRMYFLDETIDINLKLRMAELRLVST